MLHLAKASTVVRNTRVLLERSRYGPSMYWQQLSRPKAIPCSLLQTQWCMLLCSAEPQSRVTWSLWSDPSRSCPGEVSKLRRAVRARLPSVDNQSITKGGSDNLMKDIACFSISITLSSLDRSRIGLLHNQLRHDAIGMRLPRISSSTVYLRGRSGNSCSFQHKSRPAISSGAFTLVKTIF